MNREALWDLKQLRRISTRTVGLLPGMDSGTVSDIKCDWNLSSFFPVNTGVRQGCIPASYILTLA